MTYIPQKGYRNNQLITEQSSSTWDDVQSLLGWAGFIPVIGDVIDAINGIIYFFRNKIMLGAFSLIAALPGVGSVLATAITKVYNKIGKPFMEVFKKLFTNGSGAAKALFELVGKSSKWVQGKLAPLFTALKNAAGKISTFLGKVNVASFNKKILDFTGGWFGLPPIAVKTIDGFVKQLKGFFHHMAKPPTNLVNVTKKSIKTSGKETIKGLTAKEEEAYTRAYATTKVDKTKYTTLEKYIEASERLKKTKSSKIKQQMTSELKLWSKDTARVEKLQKILGIKVDGVFGDTTELAVKKWQKKNNLIQDGVVGPDTWAKMT
jgi:peptidoglycan hydrolase-like protein with peptidoglycan-binding domain